MAMENTVSKDFDPPLLIVDIAFDCRLPGVLLIWIPHVEEKQCGS